MRTGDKIKKIWHEDKVTKNIYWTVLAKVAAMLFVFLTDILTARFLGVGEYGKWTYFFSVKTMIAYLCYFGIDQAAKVIIARLEEPDIVKKYFQISMWLRTVLNLIFAVLVWETASELLQLLDAKGQYTGLVFLIKFAGILAAFNAFQEFFKAIGYGVRDNKTVFVLTVTEYGVSFIGVLMAMLVLQNIYGVLIGYVISGAVVLFISLLVLHRNHKLLDRVQLQKRDFMIIKEIMRYALPLLMANIANMISLEFDTIMLGKLNGLEQVAIYNIAKKVCTKVAQVNLAIATGTMASFAIINKENIQQKLKEFKKIFVLNALATVLIGLFLLPMAVIGIPVIYGEKYAGATEVMLWFIPFYLMYATSIFFAVFMDYRGKSTMRSMVSIVVIIMNVGLNYLFIPRYGAVGAVWTTLITQCPYMLFVTINAKRIIKKLKRQCVV